MYYLPHVYQDTVRKEPRKTEQQGTIERSSWVAQKVLVKEKDKTLVICVNYRCLNALSKGDVKSG